MSKLKLLVSIVFMSTVCFTACTTAPKEISTVTESSDKEKPENLEIAKITDDTTLGNFVLGYTSDDQKLPSFKVYIDDLAVGKIRPYEYVELSIDPGEYTLSLVGMFFNNDKIKIIVRDGQMLAYDVSGSPAAMGSIFGKKNAVQIQGKNANLYRKTLLECCKRDNSQL